MKTFVEFLSEGKQRQERLEKALARLDREVGLTQQQYVQSRGNDAKRHKRMMDAINAVHQRVSKMNKQLLTSKSDDKNRIMKLKTSKPFNEGILTNLAKKIGNVSNIDDTKDYGAAGREWQFRNNNHNMITFKQYLNEDLRQWFDKDHPKGGWKRIDSKGKVIGPCAREPGEPKPKCMSNEKRKALSTKERAAAVRRKRREDPNPDREGDPINVSNYSESVELISEKSQPTNPSLWSRAVSLAKQKFNIYPSAYANGWAAKWYKSKGGRWRSGK